jgi:hypothetical protein
MGIERKSSSNTGLGYRGIVVRLTASPVQATCSARETARCSTTVAAGWLDLVGCPPALFIIDGQAVFRMMVIREFAV